MKFTLSWLRDHLDFDAPLAEVAATLTKIGLEVERLEDPAEKLKDFVIARVIEAKQHPDADRLRVCIVDFGAGAPVQVVCGAPNARTGMKGVFSPVGSFIPGKNLVLKKGVIRGVESNGMLVSEAELELSDDHDGIIDLAEDAPVGAPYAAYAGLDAIIEINLTPNRPDAASVAGVARDLAAAGLGRLKTPSVEPVAGRFPCPVGVALDFPAQDAHLAPLFALRLVRGVKNGPSPAWMQARLRAIGLRPINALVDITNYVTFDRGRPLHVFDAKKVSGDLVVRRAAEGERVLALDGRMHALDPSIVVIADRNGVESIAGIMGGEHSGCDDSTTEVLIESALWDPLNIAQSGRRLGVVTDARYRFERGVDPAFCLPGAELATRLVQEICGGEASSLVVAGAAPPAPAAIAYPFAEAKRLTGLDLPPDAQKATLTRLGFAVEGDGPVAKVTPPTWRPDVHGKADLVEEVVRIAGLEAVPATPLPRLSAAVAAPVLTLAQKRTARARRALAARGLIEAVNWSFISAEAAKRFGGGAPALALANPIAADLSDMRPSLAPGLVAAAQRNADRGFGDVALFEVGQIFLGEGENDQRMAAAAVRRGGAGVAGAGRDWRRPAADVDAFDAKSDALALLAALGVSLAAAQIAPGGPDFLHPGRSATIQFGPKAVAGWFGEFHPRALEAMGAAGPLCGFEIILDALPAPKQRPTKIKPKLALSDFMPLERDFAFVVDRDVRAGDILRAAQAGARELVDVATVFDVYEGPGVADGKKSVAIAVRLQPRERTLTDAEIDAAAAKIVAEVARKTGASLRS